MDIRKIEKQDDGDYLVKYEGGDITFCNKENLNKLLNESEIKNSCFQVRCTAEQKQILYELSKSEGRSLSNYILWRLFN